MGKTVTRAATAFATGGISEEVRAGMTAAHGDIAGAIGNSVLPMGPGAAANQAIEPTATKVAGKALDSIGLGSGKLTNPSVPLAAKLPDIPAPDQAAVAAKQDEADRQVRIAAANKTNTVATSSQGDLGEAPSSSPSLIGRQLYKLLG